MLRNLLGVEKLSKAQKGKTDLFANVDETHNLGIIKYVGDELVDRFTIGQKIYYGNVREQIRMEGTDIMIMDEKNVFAKVEA